MEPSEHRVLLAIAEAATPAGPSLGPIGPELAEECCALVTEQFGPGGWEHYRSLLRVLDLASIPTHGARLSRLPFHEREDALRRLSQARATFWVTRVLLAPVRIARWQRSPLRQELGCGVAERSPLTLVREPARWEQQLVDARTLDADEELEVDAVVVGTGAGGAPVAHALASRGHAVIMLEAGGHFTRQDFAGSPFARQRALYYQGGAVTTLGNTVIPVPTGRSVGGTTTINSGTCYRVPASVQRRWELELGLRGLRPGALDPYQERVEAMLGVAPARERHLEGSSRAIARGCEALGYQHGPLARNAPDCDGQGACCFGCPTDAKRSTNVSYVPRALERGAQLFHHAEVQEVLMAGGRAVGVLATARRRDGRTVKLRVRARAVVLACGTLHTPLLLQRQGLANRSGQVGRNLTIHPAAYALAEFDEPIRGWSGIPQGYAIEEFVDHGIRFEGAFPPPELLVATLTRVGAEWTELVEQMEHLASFGFMIAEESRGRVLAGPGGLPLLRYDLVDRDVARLTRGMATLARVYLAAGARAVYPGMQLFSKLRSLADVERLEREGPRLLRAHHFDLTAYHPLGTCRMGADPTRSVVGPGHETHDVDGLFISDGSAVPGPLGVNPQVTIMAFAERAAEHVERRLEQPASATTVALPRPAAVEFAETMSGEVCLTGAGEARGAPARPAIFHVTASYEGGLGEVLGAGGGTVALSGEVFVEGLASHVPCRGSLRVRPRRSRATLVYDLTFDADDGRRLALHGEKHVQPRRALTGMTTLYTDIRDVAAGDVIAQGVLRFDLGDLSPWFRSMRYVAGSAGGTGGSSAATA